MTEDATPPPRYAFIGVRSCDLHAIGVQDRVFLDGGYVDRDYQRAPRGRVHRRGQLRAGGRTCFCVSMDTGPEGDAPASTSRSPRCSRTAATASWSRSAASAAPRCWPSSTSREAEARELAAADAGVENAAAGQTRSIDTDGIRDLLYRNREHPRWDEVADRCLTCGNCTMVCPTCFCPTVEDVTDLAGEEAERVRRWDSCFTLEHSYIHGGSVRTRRRSRATASG